MHTRERGFTHYLVGLSFVAAAACADGGSNPIAPLVDASVNEDTGVAPMPLTFESTVVDGLQSSAIIGDNAVLALDPSGSPAIAYGVVPFDSSDRVIRFATRGTGGEWSTELVVDLGADPEVNVAGGDLVGLGFTYVGTTPHVVYLGGDGDNNPRTPFRTDLALSTRQGGQWSEQILVDMSADVPGDCPDFDPGCNMGNVVGTYASIAASGNAYAIGFRDTHTGFEEIALSLSDVKMVGSGVAVERSVADLRRGGGEYTDIALTPDRRPVLAYNIRVDVSDEDRVGVWAAVYRNGEWIRRKLGPGFTTARTSVEVAQDGTIYVAYFDTLEDDLVLATSTDDGDTWSRQIVDASGKVGLHPSLALDANDRPVIAYTYCGLTSDRDCPGDLGARSVVRLARFDGTDWVISMVDDGQGRGRVGLFNSMAIAPDGTIYVAFQDTQESDLVIAEARP